MNPQTEVIIVNYNAGEALSRCVQSVLSQGMPVHVTVVDNHSTDDSIDRLRRSLGDISELTLLPRKDNPGFATAVNQAAQNLESNDSFLLILNPDCEMLPGSLAALSGALQDDSAAGLAGPMVVDRSGAVMRGTFRRFPDPWKSFLTVSGLWRLGRRFPAFKGIEAIGQLPSETTRAEAVSGACMLLRSSVFYDLGCLDPAYGLHCEDLDLMYRLRENGHHSLYVPSARVYHQQGLSSSSRPLWVHWQKHIGMQRFFRKFQTDNYSFPLRWLVVSGIWLHYIVTLPLAWLKR